eukprot:361935-Chlamydomonas_euryale.AAC.12
MTSFSQLPVCRVLSTRAFVACLHLVCKYCLMALFLGNHSWNKLVIRTPWCHCSQDYKALPVSQRQGRGGRGAPPDLGDDDDDATLGHGKLVDTAAHAAKAPSTMGDVERFRQLKQHYRKQGTQRGGRSGSGGPASRCESGMCLFV